MSQAESGRVMQKQRTRRALLAAARELLDAGTTPTGIQEIADHAGISRATAYRYYASAERLLEEAVLDGIASRVEALSLPREGAKPTPQDSLTSTVDAIVDMVLANEALFRTYLRNVVAGDDRQPRGARRIGWLQEALQASGAKLSPGEATRLLHALSLLTGIETVVVSKDVCGLDDVQTRELCRWTAQAIIGAALRDAAPPKPGV